jgi:hypothetical protein
MEANMADDRFAHVLQDGLEHGWRCLSEVESPDTLVDARAVAEWVEGSLKDLDLPQNRLKRVMQAVERALVNYIGRTVTIRPASQPRSLVLIRVMVPEGAATQGGNPGDNEQAGDEAGGRAWGLFVVERLGGSVTADGGPDPIIDVYLYAEGENGG